MKMFCIRNRTFFFYRKKNLLFLNATWRPCKTSITSVWTRKTFEWVNGWENRKLETVEGCLRRNRQDIINYYRNKYRKIFIKFSFHLALFHVSKQFLHVTRQRFIINSYVVYAKKSGMHEKNIVTKLLI